MTKATIKATEKTSKIAKTPRPVEDQVIAAETVKEEAYMPRFGNDEALTEKHHKTRVFVKRLFSCKDQASVDAVMADAETESDVYFEQFGEDPHYELRIRNAEVQVRKFIEAGIDLRKVNPTVACVRMESISAKTTVDSWGHLADRLLKGYEVRI